MQKLQDANSIEKNSSFEKLLFKIIIQFSVYTRGLDKRLDPYLDRIREQLKSGYSPKKIQPELNALSSNLATLGNAEKNQSERKNLLLFDCLKLTTNNPEIQNKLDLIQQRAEHQEFESEQSLADAIKRVLAFGKQEISISEISGALNKEQFSHFLNSLVSEIDIPAGYNHSVSLLKQKAQKARNEKAFQNVINDTIKLLQTIRNHAVKEQKGIDSFLQSLSGQLTQVEDHASSVTESNQTATTNRNLIKETIREQIETIKCTTADNDEFSPLQQNINSQLEEITERLSQHFDSETQQQQQTEQKLVEMTEKLQEMEEETKSLRFNLKLAHENALHDFLTGLPNRQAYDDRIEQEHARWKRYQTPLTLVVWDIDHFKKINDTFGHKAGDKTLCLIAQLLRDNCRIPDFVARFGGEEFVMLLPNTTADQALILTEKLRHLIETTGFNSHGNAINITVSCGISDFNGNDTQEAVFERADQALYQAKEQGRNRCVIADPA